VPSLATHAVGVGLSKVVTNQHNEDTRMGLFSLKLESLQQLFVKELRDLYDAEHQITEALPKMIESATASELKDALHDSFCASTKRKGRHFNPYTSNSPRGLAVLTGSCPVPMNTLPLETMGEVNLIPSPAASAAFCALLYSSSVRSVAS